MKAFFVAAAEQTIKMVDVENMADIEKLIGFESVIADEISNSTDQLFFDEDCFIRSTPGRFQLDKLPPVAGKAVIMGLDGETLQDTAFTADELTSRIQFL